MFGIYFVSLYFETKKRYMIIDWDFVLRLFVAACLGGAVGVEREYHAKEAGFRTHILVALGSALFMILSQYGFDSFLGKTSVSFDPSRIASQVVTGIGFLGAGTIIIQRHFIRGLTTAAGLWVTAAIGLACGGGMYFVAIITTCFTLLSLIFMNIFIKKVSARHIDISFRCSSQKRVHEIISALDKDAIKIKEYSMRKEQQADKEYYTVFMSIKTKRYNYKTTLLNLFNTFEQVEILSID